MGLECLYVARKGKLNSGAYFATPPPWPQDPLGPRARGPARAAGGTTPGPEDQGPPVLGPVGGAHRPWDRRLGGLGPGLKTKDTYAGNAERCLRAKRWRL